MSRVPTITSEHAENAGGRRRKRQRRRAERDLRALRTMQDTVSQGDIIRAALTIPFLAGLWFLAFLNLHVLTGSTLAALSLSLGLGAVTWAIGRHWLTFACLIFTALVILFFDDDTYEPPDAENRKDTRRRAKLAGAVAKREALLKDHEEARP